MDFNPRTPHGVRPSSKTGTCRTFYFNPRTPHGVRHAARRDAAAAAHFNPRTPHGVRPEIGPSGLFFYANFNPRTPHGVRPCPAIMGLPMRTNFNPRTPHGVRRRKRPQQPVLPYFNPRTPHGVRLGADHNNLDHFFISIHAPRTGCDRGGERSRFRRGQFQSTHPARGATMDKVPLFRSAIISIHAPRTGCDQHSGRHLYQHHYFNPRTPHGVRQSHEKYSLRP